MAEARFPINEAERLFMLRALNLLDTPMEERFDRITRIVCNTLDVPIAAISLVDDTRQWFKSRQGMDACETSRKDAFCAHAILESGMLYVPDAREDSRFCDNPLVTGEPHLRFYAGMPITIRGAFNIGTLCAVDLTPRQLTDAQMKVLIDLAKIVESEISAISLYETHYHQSNPKVVKL